MKIATISDCHGQWSKADYPQADVLVFAGDILRNYSYDRVADAAAQLDELTALGSFLRDLIKQGRYQHVVVTCGNHDFAFERMHFEAVKALLGYEPGDKEGLQREYAGGIHYLQDREVELNIKEGDKVVKRRFYGSPWQPFFHRWAFNFPDPNENVIRAAMVAKTIWKMIPDGLDVLITHGPPQGVLDECMDGTRVGCEYLMKRLEWLNKPPKVHVFGHIHHSAGIREGFGHLKTTFVNTAILGEDYTTMRKMPVIEVE